jgi:O-antigen/teichoic acid export membrane protein
MSDVSTVVVQASGCNRQAAFARRYAHSAAHTVTGGLVARALLLTQGVVVARILGVELFGVFSIITTVTLLVASLAGFGLDWALSKFLPESLVKDPGRAAAVLAHCIATTLLTATLLSAVLFLAAPVLARTLYHRPDLVGYFRLSAFIVLGTSLVQVAGAVLIAFQRFRDYAWRTAAGYGLQLVAAWIGAALFGLLGVLVGLLTGLLGGFFIILAAIRRALRDHKLSLGWGHWKLSWTLMRSILNFSVPAQLSGYVGLPVYWIATTILSRERGFREVGLFSVALAFLQASLFLQRTVSLPSVPMLSEIQATGDWQRFNRVVNGNLRALWALSLPGCFALVLLGKTIVLSFYGPQYLAAARIVFFMTFSGLLYVVTSALQAPLVSLGKMWRVLAVSCAWSAMVLGGAAFWIPKYGALGLGAAYLCGYLLWVLLLALLLHQVGVRLGANWRIAVLTVGAMLVGSCGALLGLRLSLLSLAFFGPALAWSEWVFVLSESDRELIKVILRNVKGRAVQLAKRVTAARRLSS